jgi:DNA mismatch repair ATPase MutS
MQCSVAIAYATLDHAVRNIKCFTIFVTHYPLLAQVLTLLVARVCAAVRLGCN